MATPNYTNCLSVNSDVLQAEFSSVELTEHHLDRIDRLDSEVNNITVTADMAMHAAKQADSELATATLKLNRCLAFRQQRPVLHRRRVNHVRVKILYNLSHLRRYRGCQY